MFETPKEDNGAEKGFKVRLGGNFAQQFQALDHATDATSVDTDGDGIIDINNDLVNLSNGFNLATANMNIDAQLDEGVRINLVTYLSSRHHPEGWVKGGYIQFDEMPFFNSEAVDNIMDNMTVKIGHMEVNYGDAHFRRTDNGAALYNPFVGNYIMDAFNTEIGAEAIFQKNGLLVVGSVTGGEIKGDVVEISNAPEVDDKASKSPSWIGKLGYDKQINDDFRLRATGSVYYTASSARNFLYSGDRTGSRYYLVLENTDASTSSPHTSGRYNPLFMDKVTALMGNVFLKYKGAEFFGTYENTNGRMNFETETRNANQLAAELIYRFGKNENFYLGGRYNTVNAELVGSGAEITIDRVQLSGGWYINKHILTKVEYVNQQYKDFPTNDIRNGGEFDGVMLEAVIGF